MSPAAHARPTLHHIPVCPFSQRLQILLALKGARDAVRFELVDITRPRDPRLLALTGGRTALPVLEFADGRPVLYESLVLMDYLEQALPLPPVAQRDPYRRAAERLLAAMEGPFVAAGYTWVMNRDPAQRDALHARLLQHYAALDALLRRHATGSGPWLHDDFGWAEAVYAPVFQRFWFLGWYEGFELPDEPAYARVRAWQQACVEHPAAQQVCREEIVKLYADYAWGAGNGALLPGRRRSSFTFAPHWRQRPWPPRDKSGPVPSDAALGLLENAA